MYKLTRYKTEKMQYRFLFNNTTTEYKTHFMYENGI